MLQRAASCVVDRVRNSRGGRAGDWRRTADPKLLCAQPRGHGFPQRPSAGRRHRRPGGQPRSGAARRPLLPRLDAAARVDFRRDRFGRCARHSDEAQSNGGYAIDGGPTFEQMGVRSPQALYTVVTPNYFKTMGIPIRRGRDFGEIDGDAAPLVAIVNDTLARRSFPGQDPIGRQVKTGLDGLGFMTIVGVVADVRSADPARVPPAQVYMPFEQHPFMRRRSRWCCGRAPIRCRRARPLIQQVRALTAGRAGEESTMEEALGLAVVESRFRTMCSACLPRSRSCSRWRASTASFRLRCRSAQLKSACAWRWSAAIRRSSVSPSRLGCG